MVGDVLADVVQPLAVLREVVGEDARAAERLHELELHLPLPGERVAKRELHLLAVVEHLLQAGRLESVGGPRADPEQVAPPPHGLVQVLDDQGTLLEGPARETGMRSRS